MVNVAEETQPNPLVVIYADWIYYRGFTIERVPEYLRQEVTDLLATYPSDPYFDDHRHRIADIDNLQDELDAKETPDGSQAKANAALSTAQQYTVTKLAEMVDGSPDALDTLYEIAAALNNDPDFATNIINQLAGKVDKVAGKGLFSGNYIDLSDKPNLFSGSYADLTNKPDAKFIDYGDGSQTPIYDVVNPHIIDKEIHRRIAFGTGAPPVGLEDGSVYFRYEE